MISDPKKIFSSLGLLFAAATGAYAQGTLVFANLAGGVNAPITNINGQRIVLSSGSYLADLYYSTVTNAPTDTFIAAHFNTPFSTLTLGGGGYFLGGIKTLTNVPGGTTIAAQVRVWDAYGGRTYEQAVQNGEAGYSQPEFLFVLSTPPQSPASMVGLRGFSLSWEIACFPFIDQQPQTQNAPAGSTANFGVHAIQPKILGLCPDIPLFYQWYFNFNPLPGATNTVLTLTNVQPSQSGGYRVIVRNVYYGSTYSVQANLNVLLNAPLLSALALNGTPGLNYTLQYATGLNAVSSWFDLTNILLTNNPQL